MTYDYNSWHPVKVKPTDLTQEQTRLLRDSNVFCIYPWIHLHAYPTGETYPCCHAEMKHPVGNTKTNTLRDIINSTEMRQLRSNILSEQKSSVSTLL